MAKEKIRVNDVALTYNELFFRWWNCITHAQSLCADLIIVIKCSDRTSVMVSESKEVRTKKWQNVTNNQNWNRKWSIAMVTEWILYEFNHISFPSFYFISTSITFCEAKWSASFMGAKKKHTNKNMQLNGWRVEHLWSIIDANQNRCYES